MLYYIHMLESFLRDLPHSIILSLFELIVIFKIIIFWVININRPLIVLQAVIFYLTVRGKDLNVFGIFCDTALDILKFKKYFALRADLLYV